MLIRLRLIAVALLFGFSISAAAAPLADLSVTKTGPEQAAAGSNITYTIHVFNDGPDNSVMATLVDHLPDGTSFVSASAPAAWSCSNPDPQQNNNTLVCTNPSVPVGVDDVFTYVVRIDPNTPMGTIITNGVRISTPPDPDSGATDPNEDNNIAFAITMVPGGGSSADLAVFKTADQDQARADSNVTYTIQVNNLGSSPAINASLVDTLPGDMVFVSLNQTSGPTWSCSTPPAGSGGTITCSNSSVPGSSASVFVLVGHIPAGTPSGTIYDNVASVSSSDDPNPENDSASASTSVVTATPILSTRASGSVMLGGAITDEAILSGGVNPTGSLVFFVYGPNDSSCSSAAVFTSTRMVNGNGHYVSEPFVPTLPGTYRFVADYAGDANNRSVTTACNDPGESVVVTAPSPTPTATPTATATATATPTATATATATPAGTATASPTATATATATPTATPNSAQALNLSTRVKTETGDRVMIGGFIISGNTPKAVVIRGLGPSLESFGLADLLLDPVIELRSQSGNLIFRNDNWKDSQRQLIEGTPFQPTDDRESVIVITLPPAAYTVILSGKNQTTGIGAFEVYDKNQAADSELGNMSTRGFVQTDDKVMIGGFILGGNNNTTRIAVRGLGPSLTGAGLSNVLTDPILGLYDANGGLIVSNDDWQSDPVSAAQLTANGLGLPNPKESGIFAFLPAGQFTAILAGVNGGIGIGLVEIYNLR